ncbi:phosphoribosylformimino-5-aminoimidazole carboxamide ribotide isomerase [Paenibacillus sp. J2TS4]|uniref:phosphoribosylformimino-5-aminoimidazole carboxamide ribotide isomerase n=1 Tax=Paenibacillus sp. J2TS4 TaxID=2807194 RepID=UPI001B2442DD|nr:phosphoribosylformimino-5-aminoimidazole carboxamide ribotide isomerase [Paenibacillus sp. J2TS4]GIP31595.1 1-(5-phosphoribosyl)-5-[(5-phosphoribosylamino) methylideneamino] imidazole-4-carboxamide isomerase [Paenibacillus sp. J2TS4]
MQFRPCIDLHDGKVKQIVGSSLNDGSSESLVTNFEAEMSAADYARLYAKDGLVGGHVIKLGPGNEEAALSALQAYPGGLQIGGGINADNAKQYIEAGASHVIVTSYVFQNGQIDFERLTQLVSIVGKERLVLDLSCRKREDTYFVVTDRWQKFTSYEITKENLDELSAYCAEFLIHAVDVEGLCRGIETDLVKKLGAWVTIPTTYAGGVSQFADLDLVKELGQGRIDLTIGSALDIFGGTIPYRDVVQWKG